ncbi:hypothetical protein ACF0H5_020477 [Mactra antiquata]
MLPYNHSGLTPASHQPYCVRENSYERYPSGIYSQSPMEMDKPGGLSRLCPSSLGYDVDFCGNYRQYSPSPITVEMEKFFSYPTMSITFMPCVCVPDYPVEEGKPRKICRRCSIAPSTSPRYVSIMKSFHILTYITCR